MVHVDQDGGKRFRSVLDVGSVRSRLLIEGVPARLHRVHLDAAEFLLALDRGDVDPAAYPEGGLDADR